MIKVAGYCRVSTDQEDQIHSFESQQRYFREYIKNHPDWELYEIYADEGISGTSTRKRTQFNKMMNDAYYGRFDLILTKEVSRFSRNLLDTISYTRELKNLGIGVVFLTDGFSTMDPDSELRLSIMGSIAQEESRKTSARVKWGQTRQMEKGIVFGRSMLGYEVKEGKLEINEAEAELVRSIFHRYGVEKKGTTQIARELMTEGHRTHSGNQIWHNSYILKILKNEKYIGDLVQKKTITLDYLTHRKKANHGEEPLIRIENHHAPIINRSLWNLVQQEIKNRCKRTGKTSATSNRYAFSGKIKCAQCGAGFISRVKMRKDGTSYQRWSCSHTGIQRGTHSEETRKTCNVGKIIRDELLREMVCTVFETISWDRDWIMQSILLAINKAIAQEDGEKLFPQQILTQIASLKTQKDTAIRSFCRGLLTESEFIETKAFLTQKEALLYKKLDELNAGSREASDDRQTDLENTVLKILSGQLLTDVFIKTILQYIHVHKNGKIEIKLYDIPHIWELCLEKRRGTRPARLPLSGEGYTYDPSVPMSVNNPFSSSKGME